MLAESIVGPILAAVPPSLLALAAVIASLRNSGKIRAVREECGQAHSDTTNQIGKVAEAVGVGFADAATTAQNVKDALPLPGETP